jgi:hypothetical protein
MSGFGRIFRGGWFARRSAGRGAGRGRARAPLADVRPRQRGPLAWDAPEPLLFHIDYRNDLLLRFDAGLRNAGDTPLVLRSAQVAGVEPVWDGPRAEWWEDGSVRRAVFRVEPWLPATLAPGEARARVRLLFELPPEAVPGAGSGRARGGRTARLPLVLTGEPFGTLEFEIVVSVPERGA